MTDAQAGRADVTQAGASAQPGDGRSLLEHSGWLRDHLKQGAATIGHAAAGLVQKGKEIAHDPRTKQIVHEVAQAGREVGDDQAKKVHAVTDAAQRHDAAGTVHAALPLVGEVLAPHAAAARIAEDKAAEIAEEHASPQVRSEIERRKAQADKNTQSHNKHIPDLVIDGLTDDQTARH